MLDMDDDNVKEVIESQKHHWFVEHIQAHLKDDEKVICKICNKDIDQIAQERLTKIVNTK